MLISLGIEGSFWGALSSRARQEVNKSQKEGFLGDEGDAKWCWHLTEEGV